jgi:excisionase family DNA binding protein
VGSTPEREAPAEPVQLPADPDALLDTAQAAVYLNVDESWVLRKWWRREIPAVKVGRWVRFRRVDLDAYIAARFVPAKPRRGR